MKKIIILLILSTSCVKQPKNIVNNMESIEIVNKPLIEHVAFTPTTLMEIDTLELLITKSNMEFKSWAKRNGYNYVRKSNSNYSNITNGKFASYSKKNQTISFTTDVEYKKILAIKYETNDKETYSEILKSTGNRGFYEKASNPENTTGEINFTNGSFELEFLNSEKDSLQYRVLIKEIVTKINKTKINYND